MQDKKKKNIKVRDLKPKKNAKGRFQMTGSAKTPLGRRSRHHLNTSKNKLKGWHRGSIPRCGFCLSVPRLFTNSLTN